MNASAVINLRVTSARKALWKAAAKRHGLPTLSAFVTMAADRAMNSQPVYHPAELQQLDQVREQLRYAGVNLNVLMRLLHSGQIPGSDRWKGPDVEEVLSDLQYAVAQVRAKLDTDPGA